MESESEDTGLSHTGPLSQGAFTYRKSIGRCLTLRPQRVPASSIRDENNSGDEDGQADTATPSNSATIGTVSAILAAGRRLERNPSGEPPPSNSCPDKENMSGRGLVHPYDLLTPLPRRTGPTPATGSGRTPRQPLSRIDTPYKVAEPDTAPPPPAAGAVKRPFVFGEPSAEKRPPLQHASRSHSSLQSAASAARLTPGLSRGLSEGRLTDVGAVRRSMPVISERSADSTPPEQRVAPLNQSGSAPASGPTARVSPAPSAEPTGPLEPRRAAATPYRRAELGADRLAAPADTLCGVPQTGAGSAREYQSTAYRAGQTGVGAAPAPSVSHCGTADGPGARSHARLGYRQDPTAGLGQQHTPRPRVVGQLTTASAQRVPISSHLSSSSTFNRVSESRQTAYHASVSSAVQSRLGQSVTGSAVSAATTVVSASSVHVSSSVCGSSASVLSAAPRVPSGPVADGPGRPRTAPPPPSLVEHGTQTEESGSTSMPPPPTELFFGKRQLRTLTVNHRDYIVMKQIGRGGSSKVLQVFDSDMRSLAIKQVYLENTDDATANGYKNEIELLRSLRHSDRVVQLMDFEHRVTDQMLYIVMEKGDTDLTKLLQSYTRLNEVDANMCKFFWGEMLRCVDVIHKENIIHSDLKPSNFLMVAGRLKLIDFGIASQIQSDCTSIIKDSQVGTFNYMSPEAIEAQQVTRNGASQTAIKISRRSDVWSLGCILYNFVYGITPFGHIKQPMGKLVAIVNREHPIEFPPVADCHLLAVLKGCLRRDPYQRPSIEQLLSDPYLTGCRCQCQK
ncbi:myosin light chain kinase 2, skeletal/cardiac muscle-like [Amphibalanus amphitrite]|uniref:myosin light chain kinase 2, skeletal/cardiac muscle-like n=1 Tax=Amphibalanus amphitrite TaxID=1232801 RepID=UPI001C91F1F4|nr:myosin light chain kinase 2, skeletal/cardiac muscle-like [Amphibalanus amphitrite]XP_043223625.1 myosin light chain kinase 2, skeletal/cardiac muscle-like [Amphibalanus amphitrite]XP_043223626.1 myosin light chain kinase 2, skeletal/cardiac muscle-like [Amphibalanus amphitrite]XP_043223628.1 myosin light chain kinase 2, skeletal/cardiac muscle-like [Amphibalanus amphitrite]